MSWHARPDPLETCQGYTYVCKTRGVAEGGQESVEAAPWEGPAPSFYANVVNIAGGPFDLVLVFGKQDLTARKPDGQAMIEEVARVGMSWAHAKSMIPLLARLVAAYEQEQGEIPAPGFDQNWKA